MKILATAFYAEWGAGCGPGAHCEGAEQQEVLENTM